MSRRVEFTLPAQDAKLLFYNGLRPSKGSMGRGFPESKDFSDNSQTDRVKYPN